MSDWRSFERLAARIAAELTPYATVTWNDFLHGSRERDGPPDRRLDPMVGLRPGIRDDRADQGLEQSGRLARHSGFAVIVEDVRATRGVMVCRSGFTQNAKTYARNKGISLYNLHDAESRNWRLDLTIPLLRVAHRTARRLPSSPALNRLQHAHPDGEHVLP